MKETIKSIIEWSEKTFGDNITIEGQLQKFKDEIEEWFESDQKDIEELADMAIVASSVARFSVIEAIRCFSYVAESLSYSKFTMPELEEAINKKQAKNRKRKWNKIGNKFQHIEEGGEE